MRDVTTTGLKPSNVPLLQEFDATEVMSLLVDGAYITDRDRRIVLWNAAAERITGWTAAEVVGRCCRDSILLHVDKDGHALCGEEHCPLHRSIVTNAASAEPLLVFAQHRTGRRVPVEVMVAPVRNHAGEVIGGVELFRDLTAGMQDQLRARQIQEMMVDCTLAGDGGVSFEVLYEPRDLVGGDLYRIERIKDTLYAALVADATGHGVAAALYTMLLRSLWDEHREFLASPAEFVSILNRRLHALMKSEAYFGTAIYATYDSATGELCCVRAGHPAPLLFRKSGAVENIGPACPALGLMLESVYRSATTQLEPGDALLLFTDGATEILGHEGDDLNREGLIRLVREQTAGAETPSFQLKKLQEQLLRFSREIHLTDDLTLVKILRKLK